MGMQGRPLYKPDLVIITVVWAGIRFPFLTGAITAFIGGIVIDSLSGSPTGFHAILFCAIYILCSIYSTVLQLESLFAFFILVFCADLVVNVVMAFYLAIAGISEISAVLISAILVRVFLTSLLCMAIFPILNSLYISYSGFVGRA